MLTILGGSTLQALIHLNNQMVQCFFYQNPEYLLCSISEFSVSHPGLQKLH